MRNVLNSFVPLFDVLDRYVLTGTLRRDGTDKFFPDKKYSLFPSASVAWKMSNESFMQHLSLVESIKSSCQLWCDG